MAQRRMFSPDIVSSEEFLTMPVSSQALYFHLAMHADDDGFVQPKLIMKTIGANDDDLKVLISKRFILIFQNGVIVIKHWLIHNMIRRDRYKTTRFQKEKNTLIVKENRAYTDKKELGLQNGNQMAPQIRIGKDRKEEKENSSLEFLNKIPQEVIQEMVEKFKCEPTNVITKGHALFDYCNTKGRKYKNYKSFLSNALRSDFGERPPREKKPIMEFVNGVAKVVGYK